MRSDLADWQTLNQLMDSAGGAAYVFDRERFRVNVRQLGEALTAIYPRWRIGYSYKTNHLPALCLEAAALGHYAEVVSGTEYAMARQLGVGGSDIIFNGPVKTDQELATAFREGALVNVDSLSEAEQIARLLQVTPGLSARLGLRCNLDLKWRGKVSRFGLNEASGELPRAMAVLGGCPQASIEGLHCHTSFDRSAESYQARMTRLIELADRYMSADDLQFLDVGGGICGPMPASLAAQLSVLPPSFSDYAAAIAGPLLEHYGVQDGPTLIIEPGVGLVGNVFDYVFRVEHVKDLGGRRVAVTAGAAHHIKIVPNEITPPLDIVRAPGHRDADVDQPALDIAGYTCLEHDIIGRQVSGPMRRGDILVAGCSGAYSMVHSPDFIRATPPVVEFEESGDWRILRQGRNVTELLQVFAW